LKLRLPHGLFVFVAIILASCKRDFNVVTFKPVRNKVVFSDSSSKQWKEIYKILNSDRSLYGEFEDFDSAGILRFVDGDYKAVSFTVFRRGDTLQVVNQNTNRISQRFVKSDQQSDTLLFNFIQGIGVKNRSISVNSKVFLNRIEEPKPIEIHSGTLIIRRKTN
jgi:hypothetical protein